MFFGKDLSPDRTGRTVFRTVPDSAGQFRTVPGQAGQPFRTANRTATGHEPDTNRTRTGQTGQREVRACPIQPDRPDRPESTGQCRTAPDSTGQPLQHLTLLEQDFAWWWWWWPSSTVAKPQRACTMPMHYVALSTSLKMVRASQTLPHCRCCSILLSLNKTWHGGGGGLLPWLPSLKELAPCPRSMWP